MPNSVLRKETFFIRHFQTLYKKKTNYLTISQKFRGQPIKKGQICFFVLEKAKPGNSETPGGWFGGGEV